MCAAGDILALVHSPVGVSAPTFLNRSIGELAVES
jgi:hypothetical protein